MEEFNRLATQKNDETFHHIRVIPRVTLFSDYLELWMQMQEPNVAYNTALSRKQMLKARIRPFFDARKITLASLSAMTEAAKAVLDYAFRDLRLELVAAYCSPNNGRVRRVLEKCGFQYEGSLRRCETRYDGVKLDADCWSRLTEAAGKIESQR